MAGCGAPCEARDGARRTGADTASDSADVQRVCLYAVRALLGTCPSMVLQPRTLDNTREADVTVVNPDDEEVRS